VRVGARIDDGNSLIYRLKADGSIEVYNAMGIMAIDFWQYIVIHLLFAYNCTCYPLI
jgi:hypothetical protein